MKTLNIASFNVRGLREEGKLTFLANDLDKYNVNICCLQETHIKEDIQQLIITKSGEQFYYINCFTQNQFHGIGFIIQKGIEFKVLHLHDRLSKLCLDIPEEDPNNNFYSVKTRKLFIYNIYAPWRNSDPDTYMLYNILDNELKTSSKNSFICGDF